MGPGSMGAEEGEFMERFEVCQATRLVFGRSTESEIGSLIKSCGGRRVLLVYGTRSASISGLSGRILMSLDRAGIDHAELGGVDSAARIARVREGIALCRELRLDFIVGLGGQAVADTAKAVAAGFHAADDQLWELFTGQTRIIRALPLGLIMTMNGQGGEIGDGCTLCGESAEGGLRLQAVAPCLRPAFAILNPELTTTLSLEQTASGMAGICARLLASYLSPEGGMRLDDALAEGLLRSVCEAAHVLCEDPHDYAARSDLMWAGTLCHSGFMHAGRRRDTTAELLSHCLASFYDVSLGRAMAVVLPAWLEFVQVRWQPRLAQLGANALGCMLNFRDPGVTAAQALQRLRGLFNAMGLPGSLQELGGEAADIPALLEHLLLYPVAGPACAGLDISRSLHVEAILYTAACYRRPQADEAPAGW